MGMDRPERFAAIGSHAGDCAFELCIRPRFVEVAAIYERHGGAAAFLEAVRERGPRSQGEFHAIEILALAHAYAPLASPLAAHESGGELPFDPRTAMLIPEKWARWLSHDPVVRAAEGRGFAPEQKAAEARGLVPEQKNEGGYGLREARLVFLDAGKSDEYGLQFGARLLAEQLVRSGVVVDHEEFEGGHMGTAYRYDVSLPKLIAALESLDEPTPLRAMGARVTPQPL